MPFVKCPNCGYEFLIGDDIIGNCPKCKIRLIFKKGDEKIEEVDIKKIEEEIDKIPSFKGEIIEIEEIEENEEIEKKVDEL